MRIVSHKKGEAMKLIFIILSIFLSVNANAAELKSKDDIRNFTQSVMAQVAKGKMQEGLKLMKPYLIIPESEFNVMAEQLKMQEPAMKQRFGNTIGVEFVKEEEVGNSLLRIIYIQKFEKHIMRWRFYFYKPRDSWVLNTFFSDDKLQLMFID
jgi:hypothetical protein